MGLKLDNDWHLQPIDGDTGQAFMGIRAAEKVFIKRNTSPFLAALSREGITPKLVWTKRAGNGDVLTAQEWLDGRVLNENEVGRYQEVITILRHLHHSPSLTNMLKKVGGKEISAFDLLLHYAEDLPQALRDNTYLTKVFRHLEDHLPSFDPKNYVAVHGDTNHRNWMLSDTNQLYLVDWDSAMLSDPAVDLGCILGRYVPMEKWSAWLVAYGTTPKKEVMERIHWYGTMHQLEQIKVQYRKRNFKKMNEEILILKTNYNYL
ncbi:phosphotransferase family protein [Enterococcus timonensis]|uniref:phosphotransferase family protein n=1 Tax=Enterococcus timonensis TaxID=1852364 RepID=UPI0008DAC386|nr:phosphotransferase family protein [Enterococcus timonensis]